MFKSFYHFRIHVANVVANKKSFSRVEFCFSPNMVIGFFLFRPSVTGFAFCVTRISCRFFWFLPLLHCFRFSCYEASAFPLRLSLLCTFSVYTLRIQSSDVTAALSKTGHSIAIDVLVREHERTHSRSLTHTPFNKSTIHGVPSCTLQDSLPWSQQGWSANVVFLLNYFAHRLSMLMKDRSFSFPCVCRERERATEGAIMIETNYPLITDKAECMMQWVYINLLTGEDKGHRNRCDLKVSRNYWVL